MIRKKDRSKKIVIDISGPAGNAFSIMGHAEYYAKQLGLDPAPIIEDMMSSDYEHLIQVFDKHFGNYVDLER